MRGFPGHHQAAADAENVKSRFNLVFPNTKSPVILSAPMLGFANGTLAAEVSKAGGFGFFFGCNDFTPGNPQISALEKELVTARSLLGLAEASLTPMPVGVGFITAHESVTNFEKTVLPLLQDHSPQAVWLFAPDPDATPNTHEAIIPLLKNSGFTVFVQVGTVAAARQAVQHGADAIIAQGVDAGGHQHAAGAGVISLVPEVRDMLDNEFHEKEILLVAAGGIADGRGVAAALALGAEGAVMGTRFIVAQESGGPEHAKKAILATADGGVNTAKSHFFDDLKGTTLWPAMYDGRAIVSPAYKDHLSGMSLEENKQKLKEATDAQDFSRTVTWSGSGVGLVREAIPAGRIVKQTRDGAIERLKALQKWV